jgi:hypothetical protein
MVFCVAEETVRETTLVGGLEYSSVPTRADATTL